MNKIRFILGEDKHVKLLVRSPNDEPFTILTASYELARYTDIVVPWCKESVISMSIILTARLLRKKKEHIYWK